ncbi:MAG: acetone carboxylase gamma subunit, partial [Planctomycetota bacterium]
GLLLTQSDNNGLQFECDCGHVFCKSDLNWKNYAAYNRIEGKALPPQIKVHETLELVEYFCPACGIQHAVDVKEKDQPILHDLKITNWVN